MSDGVRSLYPNAGAFGVSANADKVRGNTQWLEELAVFMGMHPDFDGTLSYTSGQLTGSLWVEQLASATVDGRVNGTRKQARETLTYTSGQLTKVKREFSYDNGGTWAIWTGRAGNAFENLGYTSGLLTTITRATS